jgi:hypothetical protein
VNQVDEVVVVLENGVAFKLRGTFICKCSRRLWCNFRLDQALDGHLLLSSHVFGQEDHSKRAMIKRGNGPESSIKDLILLKVFLHAVHAEVFDAEQVY